MVPEEAPEFAEELEEAPLAGRRFAAGIEVATAVGSVWLFRVARGGAAAPGVSGCGTAHRGGMSTHGVATHAMAMPTHALATHALATHALATHAVAMCRGAPLGFGREVGGERCRVSPLVALADGLAVISKSDPGRVGRHAVIRSSGGSGRQGSGPGRIVKKNAITMTRGVQVFTSYGSDRNTQPK
jgi:hypothetical protein